jgi:hypothetical protein
MAVTFQAAGALAVDNAIVTLPVVAPSCLANDILICCLINKNVTANAVTPPTGWTAVIATEVNDCTTAAADHQYSIYWKRAVAADSGATFNFVKATDDNLLFAGVISAWRGAVTSDSPLDATAPVRTETAADSDNVSFPAFDPAVACHVVFVAFYGNDNTTFAAAMSNDVDPDCTTRFDLESGTGNDCSIACTSGDSSGANIAARTWASVSTADAGNTGVVFGLVPATAKATRQNSYRRRRVG